MTAPLQWLTLMKRWAPSIYMIYMWKLVWGPVVMDVTLAMVESHCSESEH